MLVASLNAIRSLLKTTFPAVTRTYINSVPAQFKRPSFFVQLVTAHNEDLNKSMYLQQSTWQIVYFAPLDANLNPDALNQYAMAGQLEGAIMDSMVLIGDGVIHHIVDCEGSPRDNEAYITVRLEAEWTRPSETYDLMQDIQHLQQIGEVIIS